jgi:hypothetical protein
VQLQDLRVIPDRDVERPTYLGLQKHLRSRYPASNFLTTYTAFKALNKSDAALTLRMQWGSMIQRVQGVSAEKAVQFVEKWPTPHAFFLEAEDHTLKVAGENARLEAEAEASGSKKKVKTRKAEDFVVDTLPPEGPRAIKGKVGGRIYNLFMTKDKYLE